MVHCEVVMDLSSVGRLVNESAEDMDENFESQTEVER